MKCWRKSPACARTSAIPLVTPTSQIVGTQAVLNVLGGERYKTIAKETAGILKGEYGHTPGTG